MLVNAILSLHSYYSYSHDLLIVQGAAKRVEGMTPASLIVLLKYVQRQNRTTGGLPSDVVS